MWPGIFKSPADLLHGSKSFFGMMVRLLSSIIHWSSKNSLSSTYIMKASDLEWQKWPKLYGSSHTSDLNTCEPLLWIRVTFPFVNIYSEKHQKLLNVEKKKHILETSGERINREKIKANSKTCFWKAALRNRLRAACSSSYCQMVWCNHNDMPKRR